jgi:hypothetical protein
MRLNINSLLNKNHEFIKSILFAWLGNYIKLKCKKCGVVLIQWCDDNRTENIWHGNGLTHNEPVYENLDVLKKELLTCDEYIIKNIIE